MFLGPKPGKLREVAGSPGPVGPAPVVAVACEGGNEAGGRKHVAGADGGPPGGVGGVAHGGPAGQAVAAFTLTPVYAIT
jgi:hypothetical protein